MNYLLFLIIINFTYKSSSALLHTMEERNNSKGLLYISDVQSERFRRQSSMMSKQIISIPGYRVDNNKPSQSSSIFCPRNSSIYPLKSIVISNIGLTNTATLSIPNHPQSMMNTTKTRDSLLIFHDPPKSQCYKLNFFSSTFRNDPVDMNNIKVQFMYDSSNQRMDEMTSNEYGNLYHPPTRNTNAPCGSITCHNGGVCVNMDANRPGCQCDSSNRWLGTTCTIPNPCIRIPCKNRGQCYYLPDATYHCMCYSGYSGNNCQFSGVVTTTTTTKTTTARISHNACTSSHPCLNGGTCSPKGTHSDFTCVCPHRYTGNRCQSLNHITSTTTIPTLTCGICDLKGRIDFGDRIVNGQPVYTYVWPWIVSLQRSGSHFCGGTLIDTLHVITAAHCFDTSGVSISTYKVVAGLLNLRQTHSSNVQQFTIDRIFRHEQYSSTKLINDIAILKLRTPAKITSAVYPICLPGSNVSQDPQTGQIVQIAGWGYTNSATKQISPQLQEAYIEILNTNGDSHGGPGCNVWAQRGHPMDKNRQICAMSRDTRTDSCQGDSGGPLIRNFNTKWFLFGIVSYGDAICASSKAAGVYTRVSAYTNWIEQKLKL